MRLRDRTLAEIGKFCLDVAKYCATVILLNRFLNSDSNITTGMFVTLVACIVAFFFLGYFFLEKRGRDASSETISTHQSSTVKVQSKNRRK